MNRAAEVAVNGAIAAVPPAIRVELLLHFGETIRANRTGEWDLAIVASAKFCEAMYTAVLSLLTNNPSLMPSKPQNFPGACQALENHVHASRALRIQIPRVLVGVYEIRNNRGSAHVNADFKASPHDSIYCTTAVKWLLADLVRELGGHSPIAASKLAEEIIQPESPDVWHSDLGTRVLRPDLTTGDRVLLYLAQSGVPRSVDEVAIATGYKNKSRLANEIMAELQENGQVAFDHALRLAQISPLGRKRASALSAVE